MPRNRPLPDLVYDSKLETYIQGDCTEHVFYEAGRSLRERQKRRVESWERDCTLGNGAFGVVYREKLRGGSRPVYRAVKRISKQAAEGEDLDYIRELEAIAKFSNWRYSHCFVRSEGWFELDDSVFITMEYLEHGDLQKYLTRPFPEAEAAPIVAQVLEGLQFMHNSGFVHRDLKPGNIMVVDKGPDWYVKIADFGISKRRQQGVTTLHTMQRGTLGFAAPEVLGMNADMEDSTSSYTFSVDMWSLGAVAFYLLTKSMAFGNAAKIFKYALGTLKFPIEALESKQTSEDGKDLIKSLLSSKPEDRPTASSAAAHKWFDSHTMAQDARHTPPLSAEPPPEDPNPNDGVMASLEASEKRNPIITHETITSEASAVWPDEEQDTLKPRTMTGKVTQVDRQKVANFPDQRPRFDLAESLEQMFLNKEKSTTRGHQTSSNPHFDGADTGGKGIHTSQELGDVPKFHYGIDHKTIGAGLDDENHTLFTHQIPSRPSWPQDQSPRASSNPSSSRLGTNGKGRHLKQQLAGESSIHYQPDNKMVGDRWDDEDYTMLHQERPSHPPPPQHRSAHIPDGHEEVGRYPSNRLSHPLPPQQRSDPESHQGRRVRIVSPPRKRSQKRPLKGILKQPRDRFPEDEQFIGEGLTKVDPRAKSAPRVTQWTEISRDLVSPEALANGKERFEMTDDSVIVLRSLSKEEVEGYVKASKVYFARNAQVYN